MNEADFKLHPFSIDPRDAGISLEGTVRRDGGRLGLEYRLQGPLDRLSIPPVVPHPQRRHELWKEICFECFIRPAGAAAYWELNLSPAGHWNLYRFDGYRQGMREEPLVIGLPVNVRKIEGALSLSTEMDLGAFGSGDFKIGLSAVIRAPDGRLEYWALAHPVSKPDFHHPKSFLLML
ncbi:MAG: DOMON-like domain-containing protein [Desulfatitalea sp.]|nr:DOMON-like domain-containing protein [Desulfatitalea sp.]